MLNQKAITLEEGKALRIPNKYDYQLHILNKTIKDKTGYFVKVDKNTFGPFAKIILQRTKADEDRYMICMANAVEAYVVRIGINGFEIVEKLDHTNEAIDYLRAKNMARNIEGLKKLGSNSKYVIYQTSDDKLFVELKGVPLKDLSNYKMFDSYKELYLYYLLKFNDNIFFDTACLYNQYSPKIFNIIDRKIKRNSVGADCGNTHRKEDSFINAKLELDIINALKEKFSIEELKQFEDVDAWYSKKDIFVTQSDIENFNLDEIIRFDKYSGLYYLKIGKIDCHHGADEIVIKLGKDYYVFKNHELTLVDYVDLGTAKEIVVEKAKKLCEEKQQNYNKRVEKVRSSLSRKELDYLDFYVLEKLAFRGNDEAFEVNLHDKEIKNIKREFLRLSKKQEMTFVHMEKFVDEFYMCVSSKKDFAKVAKAFIVELKTKYPNEASDILKQRFRVFDSMYYNRTFGLYDKIKYLFEGLSQQKLNSIAYAHKDTKSDIKTSETKSVNTND